MESKILLTITIHLLFTLSRRLKRRSWRIARHTTYKIAESMAFTKLLSTRSLEESKKAPRMTTTWPTEVSISSTSENSSQQKILPWTRMVWYMFHKPARRSNAESMCRSMAASKAWTSIMAIGWRSLVANTVINTSRILAIYNGQSTTKSSFWCLRLWILLELSIILLVVGNSLLSLQSQNGIPTKEAKQALSRKWWIDSCLVLQR